MLLVAIIVIIIIIASYYVTMNSKWTRSPNINLMDVAAKANLNSSQRLIGNFPTEAKCAEACLPLSWCNYYTWFGLDTTNSTNSTNKQGECWGLVNTSNSTEQTGVFSGQRK